MSFCENCGAILMPEKGENGKVFLVCPKCQNSNAVTREKNDYLKLDPREGAMGAEKRKTIIIDKTNIDQDALASIEVQCPKCGHDKAAQWSLQTRSADEASTVFFRCSRCEHTWRDYGG